MTAPRPRRTLRQRLIAFIGTAVVMLVLLAAFQIIVAWYVFAGP